MIWVLVKPNLLGQDRWHEDVFRVVEGIMARNRV
jgi:hypothetical protein